jgi:hypothetical protein
VDGVYGKPSLNSAVALPSFLGAPREGVTLLPSPSQYDQSSEGDQLPVPTGKNTYDAYYWLFNVLTSW